jgi:DNA-binding NarL/FixJ family response regulator
MEWSMKVRILLADDHTIVRQSLRKFLENESDFELVGDAENGLAALQMIEKHRPDIVLLDLQMEGLNGLEVLRRARARFPRTRVVVLSMHQDSSYVVRSLKNGASAYVLKSADVKDLVHAMREVVAGRNYLSPPFSQVAIEAYMNKTASKAKTSYDLLTNREKEVLQLVAEATPTRSASACSSARGRSDAPRTRDGLGLQNQAELVLYPRMGLDRDRQSGSGCRRAATSAPAPNSGTRTRRRSGRGRPKPNLVDQGFLAGENPPWIADHRHRR